MFAKALICLGLSIELTNGPYVPSDYGPDALIRVVILTRQFGNRSLSSPVTDSNVIDLNPSESGFRTFLAKRMRKVARRLTPLAIAIRHVVLNSASEKVRTPNAKRRVAMVKNPQAFGYGAVLKNEPGSVCSHTLLDSTGSDLAVTVSLIDRPDPYPAVSKFGSMGGDWSILIDLGPKPFGEIFGKTLLGEVLRGYRDHVVSFSSVCLTGATELLCYIMSVFRKQSPPQLRSLGCGGYWQPGPSGRGARSAGLEKG